MDPDVAHPRHQSNQTVRNREEEEEGGGRSEGGGGRLSPGCRAAFFLRWSWTKPHTTTSSTSPPRILKIDPWHLKWWENVHIRELCKLQAHRDTFHFLWWHAWMRNGNIPQRREDILLMFSPWMSHSCLCRQWFSKCGSGTSRGLFFFLIVSRFTWFIFTLTTSIITSNASSCLQNPRTHVYKPSVKHFSHYRILNTFKRGLKLSFKHSLSLKVFISHPESSLII